MNVAQLYILLGVKGNTQLVGALTKVKSGLGEAASMSLEAKAGILAALYALERYTVASAQLGTHLENFSALTGFSKQLTQEYDYAARQVGVSTGAIEGSLKSLQSVMTNIDFNKGTPEYLLSINQALTAFGSGAINFDRKSDTNYVAQKLFEVARMKNISERVRRQFLTPLLGDDVLAGAMRGGFTPATLAKAPKYSDKEVDQLDKVNIQWSNLNAKIEMVIGRLNAKHGSQLVKDFSAIVSATGSLVDSLDTLAEKVQIFDKLGKTLEGTANSIKLISEIIDKIQGKESHKGDLLYTEPGQEALPGLAESPVAAFFKAFWARKGIEGAFEAGRKAYQAQDQEFVPGRSGYKTQDQDFVPGRSGYKSGGNTHHTTVHNKVNVSVPESKVSPKEIGDEVVKQIDDYTRQVGSQGQVN